MTQESDPKSHPISENIDSNNRLEEEATQSRTRSERFADAIGTHAGHIRFIAIEVIAIIVWIVLNTPLAGIHKFDPYPYPLLCLILTIEALLLSAFVLSKQSRMSRRADARDHLALQINMLSEQETTRILKLVDRIARKLDIDEPDPDGDRLREDTEIEHIARAVKQKISTG